MRSLYSIAIFLFSFIGAAQAQAPNWLWAKSAGGEYSAGVNRICTDMSGNAYIVGGIDSPFVVFGNDTLFSDGYGGNIYIVKYDPSGNVIWARSVKGTGNDGAAGVCTDAHANIYITGSFTSPILVFGNDTIINGTNSSEIFIAKYDSSGNPLWARYEPEAGTYNYASSIVADAQGNAYITGSFNTSTVDFGGIILNNPGNNINPFIVKYDALGNVVWAQAASSGYISEGSGVSLDAMGNVYVIGVYYSNPVFVLGGDTLLGQGFFISKIESSGTVLWTKAGVESFTGYDYHVWAAGISSDASGNSYISGIFRDSVIFGTNILIDAGWYNSYIVKLDASGNVLWAKSSNTPGTAYISAISMDNNDNAYITGSFDSSMVILGTDTLINIAPHTKTFVAMYSSNGNVLWATSLGGNGLYGDIGNGISADANGNVFVCGILTSDSFVFGPDTLVKSEAVRQNIFVAKIAASTDGIEKVSPASDITIYPNPSSGNFIFSGVQTGSSIEVYDMLGEVVYSGQSKADIYPVSLSGQAKGMYFYTVRSITGAVQQGKMVLE